MAHSYSKLYGIATTGLRYFTVYGPWGRPDMAPMLFAKAISEDIPIKIFNNGDMIRDFTYIDDIVEGTIQVLEHTPIASECANGVPYQIYNIGCSNPVKLMDFINEIEHTIGKKAQKIYLPMQPGDVYQTYADTTKLEQEIKYKPKVNLHEGIRNFINWYKSDSNPLNKSNMNIAIVGTGYVGLVSGACFAEMGINVTCIDINKEKIQSLSNGIIPIYEPGLKEMVQRNYQEGRLKFSTDLTTCLNDIEIVFSAVGTPPDEDGSADLSYVLEVARTVGRFMNKYILLVTKSTVPVGTAQKSKKQYKRN